ncbi:MAG TPA: aminodeoxychorismate/anthranilate synthase component II [Thermoplasmata archaeon]|jgi:anthranilate synthase/aminodeoxychorismate synthase-like glutamine amidotransferase
MTRILIIDNYDSFVYNIAQYLGELGATVVVERNDSPSLDDYMGKVDGYVISPGPGHPRESGRSIELLSNNGFDRPVLGVCLGHQAVAHVHGGAVVKAREVVHGKVSRIRHVPDPLFEGVPEVFSATRYHSLLVERESFPESLSVLAETAAGEIMALRVRDREIYGVQFHPESVMTSNGKTILRNFLGMCSR